MTVEEIKAELIKIKKELDEVGKSSDCSDGAFFDDIKEVEMYVMDATSLISTYCEEQGYEVEGFPHQKRKLGETDDEYDEDYFCHERYSKYIDILATTHDDVQDLMWFYQSLFAPEFFETKEEYIADLKNCLKYNIGCNIEF